MDLFAHHSTEHALFMNGTLLAAAIVCVGIVLALVFLVARGKR